MSGRRERIFFGRVRKGAAIVDWDNPFIAINGNLPGASARDVTLPDPNGDAVERAERHVQEAPARSAFHRRAAR